MEKKIKVVHFFSKMDVGGAETLILNILRKQSCKNLNYKHYFITKAKGYYDKEIVSLGGEVIYLPGPRNIFKYSKAVLKELNKLKPDVIHSHVFTFSGWNLFLGKISNIPIRIAHSHTIKSGKNSVLKKIYSCIMKWLIASNATIKVSCSVEAHNALFSKKDNFIHVTNGVDLELFKNKSKIVNQKGVYNIGHVGSFRGIKNHKKIINVFWELYKTRKDIKLHLAGMGPEMNEIKNLVKKLGVEKNVVFHGLITDIPQFLLNLDAFIFPSKYEGLGLAVIEAQAAGLKCLITDTLPSELDLNLNLNLNFRKKLTDDDKSWADELSNILNSERIIDLDNIHREIREKGYDINNTLNTLERIYQGHGV